MSGTNFIRPQMMAEVASTESEARNRRERAIFHRHNSLGAVAKFLATGKQPNGTEKAALDFFEKFGEVKEFKPHNERLGNPRWTFTNKEYQESLLALGVEAPQSGSSRNVAWMRDEILLALDFYMQNRASIPGKTSEKLINLVDEIQSVTKALGISGDEKLRNVNGVYMKLMNIRGIDPAFPDAAGLKAGGQLEKELFQEYSANPDKLRDVATSIRSGVVSVQAKEFSVTGDEPEIEDAPEGKLVTRIHRSRERNRKIVDQKKKSVLKSKGTLDCEVCGFNYAAVYGLRGVDFIECHHVKPVSEMYPGEKTNLQDLALVCANCHRMIHAKRPWLSVQELRNKIGN